MRYPKPLERRDITLREPISGERVSTLFVGNVYYIIKAKVFFSAYCQI